MMCMKGRKIDSELHQDVHYYEFVVSYVNTMKMPSGPETSFLLTQEKSVYLSTLHFQGLQ